MFQQQRKQELRISYFGLSLRSSQESLKACGIPGWLVCLSLSPPPPQPPLLVPASACRHQLSPYLPCLPREASRCTFSEEMTEPQKVWSSLGLALCTRLGHGSYVQCPVSYSAKLPDVVNCPVLLSLKTGVPHPLCRATGGLEGKSASCLALC